MSLSTDFNPKKIEADVKSALAELDLEKLIFESKNKTRKIAFIEGPPTMNGIPHAGHLRGRIMKDLWYRYMTLRGYKVIFNAGWDTQGLPVELQAEKELGISGGKSHAIESVGIEKIVAECKKIVYRFNEKWVALDKLLGMSFNQQKAYWTYKDEYIEREWKYLKKAQEIGVLSESYKVVAYCPSCQTSLSHAEVNQGYDTVVDPSLYYKVKLHHEDLYLIVWTTMPFTLVTDTMVGLNPDENYVHTKVGNETWLVGEKRLEEFMKEVKIDDYTVTKTVKGSTLEGKKYIHPLLDQIPGLEEFSRSSNFHIAVAENFVDIQTGSGLVHLSPANGEDDFEIASKRAMPIFNPINDEAKFTEKAGVYSGLFVRDADEKIVNSLKEKGALVKIGKIKHQYPLCWRSQHKLLWLARRGFFYFLDRLGDKAVQAAENVEYFFEPPRNRFLEIIKDKHPWCISRERIWGCPLPTWNCKNCKHSKWFFSREEIVKSASDLPDGPNFELHRPWIDNVSIKCEKCGSMMEREQFVLDTWHNSGAAPYASLSDEDYKDNIPALFLTEGIDQTRGWAYTLLIENVIFNNAPIAPFKSFLFQGHVLDKNGNKMSKSKGNVMDAIELLEEHSVDLVRLYFMWKSSPIEPINFSTDELVSRPYQILSTLYHLHLYFKQNSEYDKYDKKHNLRWAEGKSLLKEPEIWILSKLQKLISSVIESQDKCRFHEAARAIDDYLINSVSQVYIPITREELWAEDDSQKERRFAIYATLSEILITLDILLHPICPFITQYLYDSMFANKKNILLEDHPSSQISLTNDKVEEAFDLMKESVSVSSAARMKGKLKRRWPLDKAIICVEPGQKEKLESLSELLRSQLNVEKYEIIELQKSDGLEFVSNLLQKEMPIVPKIELERKKIGPKAKQNMGRLLDKFAQTDSSVIVNDLLKNGAHIFDLEDTKIELLKEDFIIGYSEKEGFAMSSHDYLIVFISTTRNREMLARGMIRDIARRLQVLRKERGYTPTDILESAYIVGLDDESLEMTKEKQSDLSYLVRVKKIIFEDKAKNYKDEDLDGQKIRISIE
ncbi:isoleucine--tRNA ligase [Candidatus Nitrosotalea okcheonensis]|uniref:Isoleucine--tRNA ligase n=1 Tax=Candidatus Nitrosotalea okcheonensis TaxID=1903276 RepID=A0A2H1FDY4_9ARCH|nr:isoleucine--tRNA ligase [Candidatus Nitrosotalea okcheonensis]SMH70986.1 Isoleucyl-tRNA synthetase [Candidatus Nitrosotalea okcheonensis]